MVTVEYRDATTLISVIKDWMEPGTTIISVLDWPMIAQRPQVIPILRYAIAINIFPVRNLQCTFPQVNHSICFKDPDTVANINTIEFSWQTAKASMSLAGRIKAHIPGNLVRHMFPKRCRMIKPDKTRKFLRLAENMYNRALTEAAEDLQMKSLIRRMKISCDFRTFCVEKENMLNTKWFCIQTTIT